MKIIEKWNEVDRRQAGAGMHDKRGAYQYRPEPSLSQFVFLF